MTFKSIGCCIYFGQPQDVLSTPGPPSPLPHPHWRPMMYQQFDTKKEGNQGSIKTVFPNLKFRKIGLFHYEGRF